MKKLIFTSILLLSNFAFAENTIGMLGCENDNGDVVTINVTDSNKLKGFISTRNIFVLELTNEVTKSITSGKFSELNKKRFVTVQNNSSVLFEVSGRDFKGKDKLSIMIELNNRSANPISLSNCTYQKNHKFEQ
jgi:hypothetical protein